MGDVYKLVRTQRVSLNKKYVDRATKTTGLQRRKSKVQTKKGLMNYQTSTQKVKDHHHLYHQQDQAVAGNPQANAKCDVA